MTVPFAFTTRPEIKGTFGVVATTHWIASSAAMGVLERGGNAFDAAVTAAFVLHMVEPHLNGAGGDLPALLWSAKKQKIEVLCGQGPAPEKATIAHFRSLGLDLIPGSGLLAPCVPGAVDGWLLMLRDYGTIDLADALAPAIHYAEHGAPLVPRVIETIGTVQKLFQEEWKTSGALWLDKTGALPKAFALFKQPGLAATYRKLVAAGAGNREQRIEAARKAWREGFVAEAIDRFVAGTEAMDASGRRHRGVLSGSDMAKWQAHIEAPLTYDYQDWTVAKCGPWSQGPAFLQQLAILKHFDLSGMDPAGPEFVHTVVEASKLAFADREAWYGDPDHVEVPMAALLSDTYNAARAKLITDRASLELRPGDPLGKAAKLTSIKAGDTGGVGVGEPTVGRLAGSDGKVTARGAASGDTCHIDVIDKWGNMVSATPSGGWLQSSPVIPGLGMPLNSRAQMFWLDEGLPTSLKPGRRPRTTLSPSFARAPDGTRLAYGTPGGDQQDQWQVAFLLRVIHHGMNLQQAIDAPLFHTDHLQASFDPRGFAPGHLLAEPAFPAATLQALRDRGHRLQVAAPWSAGRLTAVSHRPDGMMKAAATPRLMQAYAAGR